MRDRHEARSGAGRPLDGWGRRQRGTALIEFALVLPLILILVLATVDLGHLIQTRLIITNVSREGGSVASRSSSIDSDLINLLKLSGSPLALAGPDGRMYITRITAGKSDQAPAPAVTTQITGGSLSTASRYKSSDRNLGLTQDLYNRLVFNSNNGTADISEVTVVEIYYKYRPITPLSNFIPGLLRRDGDGMIISSKAVF